MVDKIKKFNFLFCITFFICTFSVHASINNKASIQGLRTVDVDGQVHHIGSDLDAKPTTIVFLNTHCPIARKYVPLLNQLYEFAAKNKLYFYGVVSDPAVSLLDIKTFQQEFSITFPLIFDSNGDLSKRLNPEITPEAFVINKHDEILYRGRIDNRFVSVGKQRTNITSHELQDTLHAVVREQSPTSAYEKPVGCIAPKWENETLTTNITYTQHIAPILNANCVECHRPGEVAPFSLQTYEEAKRWAPMISFVTQNRIMPPWKPVAGFGEFRDERVLSDHQISLLKQWAEKGAPKGDESDLAPAPEFGKQKWALGEPDAILKVKEAFHVPADGDDIYRFFVIPSNFKKDRSVIGIDFQPGDPSVVHHAMVFMDYSGRARKIDKQDPEPGFAVFGPGNFMNPDSSANFLAGWIPGMKPLALPKGTAMWVQKGGDVLLQIHYHLTGKVTTDQSEVAFYFQEEYPPQWIQGIAIGTQQIAIPPNEKEYTRHFYMNVPSGFHILDIAPHMHYLGNKVFVQVTFPDGKVEPLIKIEDWDMRWQNRYTYRKPFYIPAGSRIDAWYTFDNTLENPFNPNTTPQTTRWGLRSEDEMAQLWMVITPDDYYARLDLYRTSRLSWFRDASNMEVVKEENPFHSMKISDAIEIVKSKNQFIVEENKVLNQAIDSSQYEVMVQALEEYTREHKDDVDAHSTLGYLLFTKAVFNDDPKKIFEFYKNAQKSLKRALKIDPTHWRARMTLATVYKHAPGEMNLMEDAVELLEDVIADQETQIQKVEFAHAYKDLSYVHEQLGEYELALHVRFRGAKQFPKDPYFLDDPALLSSNATH